MSQYLRKSDKIVAVNMFYLMSPNSPSFYRTPLKIFSPYTGGIFDFANLIIGIDKPP